MRPVRIRRTGHTLAHRPLDSKVRIVPQNTAVAFARVVIRRLVNNLGIGFKRAQPVGKALWNQQLPPVLRRQLGGDMTAEGGRGPAQVDRNVEYSTADDAHQLVLREGRYLKMQPSDRPGALREEVVLLHEIENEPGGLERAALVDFGQEPAGIAEFLRRQQFYRGDRRRLDVEHAACRPPRHRAAGTQHSSALTASMIRSWSRSSRYGCIGRLITSSARRSLTGNPLPASG